MNAKHFEPKQLLKLLKNQVQMIDDRGYETDTTTKKSIDEIFEADLSSVETKFYSKFKFINRENENKTVELHNIVDNKKPQSTSNKNIHIVVFSYSILDNKDVKQLPNYEMRFYSDVIANPNRHMMYQKHTKLSDQEVRKLYTDIYGNRKLSYDEIRSLFAKKAKDDEYIEIRDLIVGDKTDQEIDELRKTNAEVGQMIEKYLERVRVGEEKLNETLKSFINKFISISENDAVCRWYNWKKGDVIKIERINILYSALSEKSISYSLVK